MHRYLPLFLFVMSIAAWGQAGRAAAKEHIAKGNALFDKGAYADARAEYEAASAVDPTWYEPHYELGQTFWALKMFPEAESEADKALQADPACWFCLLLRGTILDDQGKSEEALRLYAKASEMVPKQAKPHFESAVTLIRMKRVEDSIAELKRAEGLEPNYASPYFLLGNIYFGQRRFFLADEQYLRAVELEPKSERGKKAKGRRDHQIVVDSGLSSEEAKYHLSYCVVRAGQMLPDEYHKRRPTADSYAGDLEDDADVYTTWAQIISELEKGKRSNLYFLVRVRDAGFIKPFLLVTSPERYRVELEKPGQAENIAEFKKWAGQNGIPLTPIKPRCEVRWMEQTW